MKIPFFSRLLPHQRILIAGCGGGFDFVSGLPLYFYLRSLGREVWLANLSFSDLSHACSERLTQECFIVDQSCGHLGYFPERHICDWFGFKGEDVSIYGFEKTGVVRLKEAYEAIIERHDIDAVVLIDGGTDSLLKGDEPRLGTIVEDTISIVAVNEASKRKGRPETFLVCLGFGVDHFHGVCHYSFLQNTAEAIKLDAYLGAISVTKDMPEGKAYLEAVDFLNQSQPRVRSIVCNSIASAMRGEFGDYHATGRTSDSELFINPLMTFYWCYDLAKFAACIQFYERIVDSYNFYEVAETIRRHHGLADKRPWKGIPI